VYILQNQSEAELNALNNCKRMSVITELNAFVWYTPLTVLLLLQ
jgi:hypothetical protein